MLIGIDGNEANVECRVGIGQYAYQILTHINKIQNSTLNQNKYGSGLPRTVLRTGNGAKFIIYLKNPPVDDLPSESESWRYEVFGPHPFWTQFALPLNLAKSKDKPDVFFSPSHYAPRFTTIPQYISIMDMSFVRFPQLFTTKDRLQLTRWTGYSVKKARKIFTISEFSKKEIVEIYNTAENKIVVTYPGYDSEKFKIQNSKFKVKDSDQLINKYRIKNDFILFVGTLQPRKNIVGLINAYNIIVQKLRNKPLELVIIGKKGWQFEEIFYSISKIRNRDKVHMLDFVADDDLPVFYRSADCFVLPSLYEGFGIPVVEAMACGCPVVASKVSSLPEVAGGAAILVDPRNAQSIAQGIEAALTDESLRMKLVEKGLNQVKRFSWDRCAQKTLESLLN